MAFIVKPNGSDVPVLVGRRSTRLNVAVPVTIIGKDASGNSFKERAFTLSLSKHGAEIATSRPLVPNEEITIENAALGRTVKAKVIRQGEKRSPNAPYEFSVELMNPENIWGIKFPPSDWEWKVMPAPEMKDKMMEGSQAPPSKSTLEISARLQSAETRSKPGPPDNSLGVAPKPASPKPVESKPTEALPATAPPASRASPQTVAGLDERIRSAKTLEEELQVQADRLRASSSDLERLLSKSEEVRRDWNREFEKFESGIREAGTQVTQSVSSDLKEKLREGLESATGELMNQTRSRAQEQIAAALDSFSQEAATRISALKKEHVSILSDDLQSCEAEILAESKEQISQAARAALRECEEKLKPAVEQISSSHRADMGKTLAASAQATMSNLLQSLRDDAQSTLRTQSQNFEQTLDKMRLQIQEEGSLACGRLHERIIEETGRAGDDLAERVNKATDLLSRASEEAAARLHASYQKIELSLKGENDRYQGQIAQASNSSLDGFRHYLETVVEASRTELQEMSRQSREKTVEGLENELHQRVAAALEAAASQIHAQVGDSVTLASEELKRVGNGLIEDSRHHVGNLTRATIGSLTSEFQAITEEYRRQLQSKFQEIVSKTTRELELSFQQAMRREKDTFLRQLDDEAEASATRAATRVKAQCEAGAQQASDKIYRQVGEAAVVLKEWADQARERFEARYRNSVDAFQRQADDLSRVSLENARAQAANLGKNLAARFIEAARLLDTPETEVSEGQTREESEQPREPDRRH